MSTIHSILDLKNFSPYVLLLSLSNKVGMWLVTKQWESLSSLLILYAYILWMVKSCFVTSKLALKLSTIICSKLGRGLINEISNITMILLICDNEQAIKHCHLKCSWEKLNNSLCSSHAISTCAKISLILYYSNILSIFTFTFLSIYKESIFKLSLLFLRSIISNIAWARSFLSPMFSSGAYSILPKGVYAGTTLNCSSKVVIFSLKSLTSSSLSRDTLCANFYTFKLRVDTAMMEVSATLLTIKPPNSWSTSLLMLGHFLTLWRHQITSWSRLSSNNARESILSLCVGSIQCKSSHVFFLAHPKQ